MVVKNWVRNGTELCLESRDGWVSLTITRNRQLSGVVDDGKSPVFTGIAVAGSRMSLSSMQRNGEEMVIRNVEQTPATESAARQFLSCNFTDLPTTLRAYANLLRFVNEFEKSKEVNGAVTGAVVD